MQILHKANSLNVYRGTVTGLRISAVDGGATESGGAFVDNLPQAILDLIALYPGELRFETYSANGAMIWGVLKAAGSAEDVSGGELNGDPSFDTSAYWQKEDGTITVSGGQGIFTNSTNAKSLYKANLLTSPQYKLYKAITVVDSITSGSIITLIGGNRSIAGNLIAGTNTGYTIIATTSGNINIYTTSDGTTAAVNSYSIMQVLAPSTSGATIVSEKAGTTWNFAYKNASFTYNAASYFVVVRKLR